MRLAFRVIFLLLLALSSKLSFAAGTCGSDSMFFNGSHTSWVAQPMICNDVTGKWELQNILLPANSLVGFDVEGNWKYTYGGRGALSGKISKNYENIWVSKAGIYDIEIDFQQKTYALVPSVSQDLNIMTYLLTEPVIVPESEAKAKAMASVCTDAECTRQYERDSAYCRKLPNARARAICWAAAAARYGACLAMCK